MSITMILSKILSQNFACHNFKTHSGMFFYFAVSFCGLFSRFLATLRGHVSRVYQVAWSADSRLLVSGSSDSTLKVWDVKTRKLLHDLPGHADEVSTMCPSLCVGFRLTDHHRRMWFPALWSVIAVRMRTLRALSESSLC